MVLPMNLVSQAAPATTSPAAGQSWPWEPEQGVAAGLAIRSLTAFFPKNLARDGRLQVETLFCTLGALTGFAAQHAVRQTHVASGRAKETDVFAVAEGSDGVRYFFGELLNDVLVPKTLDSLSVWSIIGGAAMRLGANELPDCIEIFERTASSIGRPEFGTPELPADHKPWLMPRRAIEIFWPSVVTVFTRQPVVPVPGFKLV